MSDDHVSAELGITGLGQVALLVRQAERATRFYSDVLGLPHLYSFGDLVFFDCGGTRLYLQRVDEAAWRPGSILYFTVRDIRARHEDLAARGAKIYQEPQLIHRHDSGMEEWMSFFDDGEGNTLALMERIEPAADTG